MEGVVGVMRRVAEQETRRILTTELGVVTAVFPHQDEGDADNYQCSVQLKGKLLPDGARMELRRVPVATPYLGFAAIPGVGDLVLVQFIGGDVNAPVITGRLYDDEVRPPPNLPDELLVRHRADGGGSIRIDAEGRIVLASANGENTLALDDQAITLSNEKFSLTIDFSGEKIVISSEKDLELVASGGTLRLEGKTVEITSGGDLSLAAKQGKLSAEASEAKVSASAGLVLEGATIDLN